MAHSQGDATDIDTDIVDVDDADEGDQDAHPATSGLTPTGLKEISSLASWTVSSSKPGCGVAALRSPDMQHFWQSDGPQPHFLTIHFFKLVSIVHMRVFLDFDTDESYTPTKMQFWAGMGIHDLQEFAGMAFEQPRGWIDVDFSKVGPLPESGGAETDWAARPVLRAFLVQVRIIENHQNGKDTHLRGLQIFAADPTAEQGGAAPSASPTRVKVSAARTKPKAKSAPLKRAPWMLEPELR